MGLFSIKIKDKIFKVKVVSDEAEMKKGLSGTADLPEGRGMLFNFKEPQQVTMNMGKMNYPIDMIFIGGENKVVDVRDMRPGDVDTTCDGCKYVLEVNKGEGADLDGEKVKFTRGLAKALKLSVKEKEDSINQNIIVRGAHIDQNLGGLLKKGGTFKIYEDEVKAKEGSMQVLDHTGKVQMNIEGGERIFSINHTEQLVQMAKKVELGQATEDDLGKLMAEIIKIQNEQEPEYV